MTTTQHQPRRLRVRIVSSGYRMFWYADRIGETFDVVDVGPDYALAEDFDSKDRFRWHHIQKRDAEVVPA